MNPVAQNADFLASLASLTVKNLIKIWGSPAVPNVTANPRDMVVIGSLKNTPASLLLRLLGDC